MESTCKIFRIVFGMLQYMLDMVTISDFHGILKCVIFLLPLYI